MINKREELLTFLLVFTAISGNIDINDSFLITLVALSTDFAISLLLTFILYHLVVKHVYKWIVNNLK